MQEALAHGKEGAFRGQIYREIVECNKTKGGNFLKISNIQNGVVVNVVVPGEYVFSVRENFRNCIESFFKSVLTQFWRNRVNRRS